MKLIPILLSLSPSFQTPEESLDQAPEPAAPRAQETSREPRALAAERQELADIRLLLGAQRDYQKARERLLALKRRLGANSDTGQAEAGTPELLATVEALELEVRRALGEAVEASTPVGSQDKVDEAVLSALRSNDFVFVMGMGRRSVPALEDYIRTFPDDYPGIRDEDPLWYLRQLDALAFSQVAGEQLESGSFFWKKRVMRVIDYALPDRNELWTAGSPRRWLGEGLSRTAEKYAEDAEVGIEAMRFLLELAERGERSALLDRVLARALRSPDAVRRGAAMELARGKADVVGLPAFEALLDEPDADLRSFAASVLTSRKVPDSFRMSPKLLQHADDPDPSVRDRVAYRLSKTDKGWQQAERTALERLLLDSDEGVCKRARAVLGSFSVEEAVFWPPEEERQGRKITRDVYVQPMPDEVYRSLLGRGFDAEVAHIVARLPAPLCFELSEVLAASAEPSAASQFVEWFYHLPYWEDPRATLRIVDLLRANPLIGADALDDLLQRMGFLAVTRDGLEALVRWGLAQPVDEVLETLYANREAFDFKKIAQLEPDLASEFCARLYAVDRKQVRRFFSKSREGEPHWVGGLSQASRGLAQDPTRPLGLRLLALNGVLNDGTCDEDFLELVSPLLDDPMWQADAGWEREEFFDLFRRDIEPAANPLILRILRHLSLPESMSILAVPSMRPALPGAEEILRAVLERGFESEPWTQAVSTVLNAMGDVPGLQDPEVLAKAAWHPRHARAALRAVRRLRDARYLSLLTEIVATPRDAYQLKWATEALFGFLDAEAVEPLLTAAARVEDAEVRDQCLAHLEKIREYQDARERWATRQVHTQTRAEVIAQLVTQLDDPSEEIRVQAVRALGTWDAVEAMPRLIELTTSESESVAAAARESLERLNASEKD